MTSNAARKRAITPIRQCEPLTINDETLAAGIEYLSTRDRSLAKIARELGPPPIWQREPGFATLVHIVLEQQVSLASARAAFNRLSAAANPLTPAGFLEFDDATLKNFGFSRQKTTYCRHLSQSVIEGTLDIGALHSRADEDVRAELVKIKGIGNWTADIYLLMVLLRPDVWPSGDLALAVAAQRIKRLEKRPGPAELEAMSARWRPWRAVAARLLWHYYLST